MAAAMTKLEFHLRNEVHRTDGGEVVGTQQYRNRLERAFPSHHGSGEAADAREMLKEYLGHLEQKRVHEISNIVLSSCMEVVNEASKVMARDNELSLLHSHEHGDGCGTDLEGLRTSLLNVKSVMQAMEVLVGFLDSKDK